MKRKYYIYIGLGVALIIFLQINIFYLNDNRSVIIGLTNNDCQRCTEKVERLVEILSEKISKKRIVFILENYDKYRWFILK